MEVESIIRYYYIVSNNCFSGGYFPCCPSLASKTPAKGASLAISCTISLPSVWRVRAPDAGVGAVPSGSQVLDSVHTQAESSRATVWPRETETRLWTLSLLGLGALSHSGPADLSRQQPEAHRQVAHRADLPAVGQGATSRTTASRVCLFAVGVVCLQGAKMGGERSWGSCTDTDCPSAREDVLA